MERIHLLHVAYPFAHAKRALRPIGALKGDATCINYPCILDFVDLVDPSYIWMAKLFKGFRYMQFFRLLKTVRCGLFDDINFKYSQRLSRKCRVPLMIYIVYKLQVLWAVVYKIVWIWQNLATTKEGLLKVFLKFSVIDGVRYY